MKHLLVILFLSLPFFISCSEPEKEKVNEEENKFTHSLDGSWVIRRGVGEYADRQVGQVFSFKGDKFQFNHKQMSFTGDVIVNEKNFIVTPHKNKTTKSFNYYFQGDTMVMNMQNSKMTFYLVKVL